MNESRFLTDKAILVTGAGSGIGRAIATAMAERGGRVYLMGRHEDRLRETAELVQATQGLGGVLPGDIRDANAVQRAMDTIRQEAGGLDVLVNNAGVFRTGKLHEMAEEHFMESLTTNVVGLWRVTRAAVPLMQGRKGANIINLSSIAGTRTDPGMGAFQASKAAVNTITKVQAKELAPLGIRVNAIAPGPTDTHGLFVPLSGDQSKQQARETMEQMVPFGRLGDPKEIARLAVFLASPESDFISGSITSIDGAMGY